MAERCAVCGVQVSMPRAVRIREGCICRQCAEHVPATVNVRAMSPEGARRVVGYETALIEKGFDVTASYGKLLLDELHGYVLLADKTDGEGDPAGPFEIYDLADAEEIGLYPTNPRAEKSGVFCDAEFSIKLRDPPVSSKRTVKTGAKCSYKPVGGLSQKVEWTEPAELTMFRNMLDQSIDTASKRAVRERMPSFSRADVDLFRAESALYLREGYTEAEVEDHARRLIKAFEDVPDGPEAYREAVKAYKDMVKNSLGL